MRDVSEIIGKLDQNISNNNDNNEETKPEISGTVENIIYQNEENG